MFKDRPKRTRCTICGKPPKDGSKLIYYSFQKPGYNYYVMGTAHRECLP